MASGVGLRYFIKVNLQIGGVSLLYILYLLYCSVNSVDTLSYGQVDGLQRAAEGGGRRSPRVMRGARTSAGAAVPSSTQLLNGSQRVDRINRGGI